MNHMPHANVYQDAYTYEDLFTYMPWWILTSEILDIILKTTPKDWSILDLMCGPGHLLGQIAEKRGDITLEGVDSSHEFITYAQKKYPTMTFHEADVLERSLTKKYDIVLVTGGIHHLPYDAQKWFIQTIPWLLQENWIAIFADPYIGNYNNEMERKSCAAKLGYEYLLATIQNKAPASIIQAAIDILECDVTWQEYKTSISKLGPVFQETFRHVGIHKTWPAKESEYGDYYVICSL